MIGVLHDIHGSTVTVPLPKSRHSNLSMAASLEANGERVTPPSTEHSSSFVKDTSYVCAFNPSRLRSRFPDPDINLIFLRPLSPITTIHERGNSPDNFDLDSCNDFDTSTGAWLFLAFFSSGFSFGSSTMDYAWAWVWCSDLVRCSKIGAISLKGLIVDAVSLTSVEPVFAAKY
ncbi:hypothetical protein K435DRAFT_848350 [Dendrothele bispora CBS 962.96]|uniref:Uncharacterized protein n=1 Tax=Dendrothele bispora (strain CBS 962.96) TaxID=1314807 RepID=A0A4S8MVU4_DENBC|nr:hypothetical protein K435DRAFT_848350 [Dendrothele bispora CBS 962.96]